MQRKGVNLNVVGESVVQPSAIMNEVVNHPRCGRTANNKFNIVTQHGPTVPKIFKSSNKARPWRVHPRQLIDKDILIALRQCFEIRGQGMKGQQPIAMKANGGRFRIFLQRNTEV